MYLSSLADSTCKWSLRAQRASRILELSFVIVMTSDPNQSDASIGLGGTGGCCKDLSSVESLEELMC